MHDCSIYLKNVFQSFLVYHVFEGVKMFPHTHIKCMHLFNFSFWARGTVRFYHYFLICAGCSYLTIQMAITNENFCTIYEFISMGGVVGTTGWSAFIWNETDLCNRMLNTYEHFEKNIDGSWSARKHAPPFKNEIFTTICGTQYYRKQYNHVRETKVQGYMISDTTMSVSITCIGKRHFQYHFQH